ncbi:hypothetical protein [Megasphaera vaginalis (ex Srinivasan et al. 2021)]|uniref:Uncharacterized protein n=1 Tax=Megasphaera vaginalis (ex Srinivasan et al. 2021) TaxID=1111454 RepID=U7UJ44_9FIRM|nr:hypothetical protein [Megasphaera vaginalis (ex Srinivasan et al. 2021)]ERT59355.1 hypothetical protein HMPREF1250_0189 [Megasphaera vaginalis (ex Srinivasan et al. 2021)]
MYTDTVTVERMSNVKDVDGADSFAAYTVYENLPCQLSQYSEAQTAETHDREYRVGDNFRISLDPSYDIQPNDKLHVTHNGQVFLLNASRAFKYPSHQEIVGRKDSEA